MTIIPMIKLFLKEEDGATGIEYGIVKLSEFDQKFGNTRLHNSLIIQDSGSWPEGENQPNST